MFTKITKWEAKKRFLNGEIVVLCPHKMRPGFPFAMHSYIHGKLHLEERKESKHLNQLSDSQLWERMLLEWKHYNASYETGYYATYYIEE